jgi:hypothetical protein
MTIITLPTYQKHWIHTKPYGHDIVIWCDTGKTTIECRWQNTERDDDGRVKQKETKIMTDSFLSTKMKQLKNIQATVESTTGETQEMWINKWYELIRSIAKERKIERTNYMVREFLEVHLGTSLSGLSNFERGSRLRDRGQKTNKINVFRVLSSFFL